MTELPADSRITSRAVGSTLTITIPLARKSRWASWGGTASFAFLAVVCLAQGMLERRLGWTGAGIAFLVVGAWQGAMLARWGTAVIEISSDSMTILQSGRAPEQSRWNRSDVSEVRAETAGLRVGADTVLRGHNPHELQWLAEQIRRKWAMA
jgi:hypothetical protein